MDEQVAFSSTDIGLEEDIYEAIQSEGRDIFVVVKDGIVHLSGDADDFSMKRNIYSLVQRFPGVLNVIDHIRVTAKNPIRFPWNENSSEAETFRSQLRR
jgi:osmotically-inducible protein OsmY